MLHRRIEPGRLDFRHELVSAPRAYDGRAMRRTGSARIVLLALLAITAVVFSVQLLTDAFGFRGDVVTEKLTSIVVTAESVVRLG